MDDKGIVNNEIWVVNTRPGVGVVARKWRLHRGSYLPSSDILRAPTLDALRARMPPGLSVRAPLPSAPPTVVEIWS